MNNLKIHFILFLPFLLTRCHQPGETVGATVIREIVLDSIPSGSGLARWQNRLFVIGDDAAFAYEISIDGHTAQQLALYSVPGPRVLKEAKSDLEAAVTWKLEGKEHLLAFGSGSQSPQRDSLIAIDLHLFSVKSRVSIYDAYRQMRRLTQTDSRSWNVEGAASAGDSLVLLNRGNNLAIILHPSNLDNWLHAVASTELKCSFFRIALPEIDGHEARLSGAGELEAGRILFCASVEDTPDWTQDGPILGSFVGVLNCATRKVEVVAQVKYADGKPFREKIESIVLEARTGNALTVLALADNDDGRSKLLTVRLNGPNNSGPRTKK